MEPDLAQTTSFPPTAAAISSHSVVVELSIQIGAVARDNTGASCLESELSEQSPATRSDH